MSPDAIIVKCGDCGWQGPAGHLLSANGLKHCPKCGREFNYLPPYPRLPPREEP